MIPRRVVLAAWLPAVAAMAGEPSPAPAPAGVPAGGPRVTAPVTDVATAARVSVAVEFELVDAKGAAVSDLRREEVEVRQDDLPQPVDALARDAASGLYEVRYTPRSGKPGPVNVRVLRAGTRPRGPGGGALRVRVLEALRDFELPLLAALEAPQPPLAFTLGLAVLRFEQAAEGLHHTLVVEVPLRDVRVEERRAHVSLLARVRGEGGSLVQRVGLDNPIAAGPEELVPLEAQRVVWLTHLHLRPGRYQVEVAASDRLTGAIAVSRREVTVPQPAAGLRLGDVVLLDPEGARARSDGGADDPLRTEDGTAVPSVEATYVAGTAVVLPFQVYAYRGPGEEPVSLFFELRRGAEALARGPLGPLPARSAVRYGNTIPIERLPPGDYRLEISAVQGPELARSQVDFRVLDAEQFLRERGLSEKK